MIIFVVNITKGFFISDLFWLHSTNQIQNLNDSDDTLSTVFMSVLRITMENYAKTTFYLLLIFACE